MSPVSLGFPRLLATMVAVLLICAPGFATAQELATPYEVLAVQFSEGNGYYFPDEQSLPMSTYLWQNGEKNPQLTTMSAELEQTFRESGMIDQFLIGAMLMPDFVNSTYNPDGPSGVTVQIRILKFGTDVEAESYVNEGYNNKYAEYSAGHLVYPPTDLQSVPVHDQAVSGWSMTSEATVLETGGVVEFLEVNYAGQIGSFVIMARVSSAPDLAEPIARELFYAQRDCALADVPCGPWMVPAGSYPLTQTAEASSPGGGTSTSTSFSGDPSAAVQAAPASPAATDLSTDVTGSLSGTGEFTVQTSGDWVVLTGLNVGNNRVNPLVMRGTNDNYILAGVSNLGGADRVEAVLGVVSPGVGELTLIEDGGTYMIHRLDVNGVSYGVFSTIEIQSSALDSVVQVYIAPLSTFGTGMSVLQSSVTLDGNPVMPGVDGASLVQSFGGVAGDPAQDAALPALIGAP